MSQIIIPQVEIIGHYDPYSDGYRIYRRQS